MNSSPTEAETQSLCLDTIDLFADLPPELRTELSLSLEKMQLSRGDVLVKEGAPADTLYFVVSGRFEVRSSNRSAPLAEVGVNQLLGEVGFLVGGGRTATATALRDSVVLRLSRPAFDKLSQENPRIWQALTFTLATRLARRNQLGDRPADPRPRTIALIPAGPAALSMAFADRFCSLLASTSKTHIVSSQDYSSISKGAAGDPASALNALETDHDFVVYIADNELTDWSKTAVRQADLVLAVATHEPGRQQEITLNKIERFASELHNETSQRLVLLHKTRDPITGTAQWLRTRKMHMHHHVCLTDNQDCHRLIRFINGTAVGLVACGGGALCASHVGLYQALIEAGITFDMMGGTSGGAAMTAAFAMGETPDQIEQQTQDMFVTGGAMRRYTLPLYSLLDQTHFDNHLRNCYGTERTIEDLWIPFFAVSTNLSSGALHCQTTGVLWEAVRASGSVPALLPPFFTPEGDMLVDGGLVDNVPISVMRELKSGPNIVIAFHVPEHKPFDVDYSDLPSRGELLRRLATSRDRKRLGDVPLIGSVLARALMAQSKDYTPDLMSDDILLVPPLPNDIGLLDWHRHGELKSSAYEWTKSEITSRQDEGDDAWKHLSAACALPST